MKTVETQTLESIFQDILEKYNHQYSDREGQKEYVWDADAEKIVKGISNVTYIDTYQVIDKPLKNYSGFYIKKGNLSLTVYCKKNEFNSGFRLSISVIDLNRRRTEQVGGGYGTSGFDFVHESYALNMQDIKVYSQDKTISMLNEMIEEYRK